MLFRRRAGRAAALVIATALGAGLPAWAGGLAPRVPAAPGAFPWAEYDALLKKYVDDQGRVDYGALKQNDAGRVEQLYAVIAATGPDKTPALYAGQDAALAYFVTAYNVLVWKNVIDRIPGLQRVDQGLYSFFRNPDFQVNGRDLDLDDLEKKVIRPRFKDGRIHFALNCASGGCPKLPRDAFTPDKVQAQLDAESRRFCGEARNVSYDAAKGTVRLSMIFKWYKDDFGGGDRAVLAFINKYRAADAQVPVDAKISYIDYDWRMNDKSLPTR